MHTNDHVEVIARASLEELKRPPDAANFRAFIWQDTTKGGAWVVSYSYEVYGQHNHINMRFAPSDVIVFHSRTHVLQYEDPDLIPYLQSLLDNTK